MIKMKVQSLLKSVASLLFLLFFSYQASAQQLPLDTSDPYKLLDAVSHTTFTRFNSELPTIKTNPDHLKVIISDELLPHIDYKYAAFKVLGKNLSKLEKSKVKQFVTVFKDYMVTVYAQVFTNYRQTQNVVVLPGKIEAGKKLAVVRTKIVEPGRPDIDISFKLKRNKKQEWKAFDMEAEGISVLTTKRKEIGNAIKRRGIDAIILDLKQKSAQPLKLKSNKNKSGEN